MFQSLPEERSLMAVGVLAQREIQLAMMDITQKAQQFLRFRLLVTSDAQARHLFGHPRRDGDPERCCECGVHKPGWQDLRLQTLGKWKNQKAFRFVYDSMLSQPLVYAAYRLEQLAPAAMQTYQDILDPESDAKPSVKRLAARDVLQTTGLLQVEGTQGKSRNAVTESVALMIARERSVRGFELSTEQRRMLLEAGEPVQNIQLLTEGAAAVERSLDGDDVPRFGDNSSLIPD